MISPIIDKTLYRIIEDDPIKDPETAQFQLDAIKLILQHEEIRLRAKEIENGKRSRRKKSYSNPVDS